MNRPLQWFASLLIGCSAGQLSAGDLEKAWSPRKPSWPALVVNKEPEVCALMLKLSEEWFASQRPSGWAPVFLNTELDEVDFGEGLPLKLGIAYQRELDLDADGVPERVLIKGAQFRDDMFYQGFVGSASADMNLVLQSDTSMPNAPLPGGIARFPIEQKLVAWGSSRDKGLFWDTRPYPVYQWRNRYYFTGSITNSAESGLALYRLKGDGTAPLACLVRSRAAGEVIDSMTRLPEIRALEIAVSSIGSAGRAYCGTLNAGGHHDASAQESFRRVAVRPWAVSRRNEIYLADTNYFEYSSRLWKFLESWAAEDSWNKREYLTLLQALEPARRAYARFLAREFGLSDTVARSKGDEALDQWIASWFLIPRSFATEEAPETLDAPDLSAQRISSDPKQVNPFGKSNLMMAAHLNRIDHVRALLARGADPNLVTAQAEDCTYHVWRGGRTALTYAAENASPLVMKVLLDAGADPAVKDSQGNRVSFYLQRNPRLSSAQLQLPITELAASGASLADAPGFDCAKASRRPERAICENEVLRLLDAEMSQAYAKALTTPVADLATEQRRWTAWREKNCAKETGAAYVECLADVTAARERYLQYLSIVELPKS